jgi:hypothetical protein
LMFGLKASPARMLASVSLAVWLAVSRRSHLYLGSHAQFGLIQLVARNPKADSKIRWLAYHHVVSGG